MKAIEKVQIEYKKYKAKTLILIFKVTIIKRGREIVYAQKEE